MDRTKANAGILAISAGFVGAHRFFLYRPWSGVLYLVPAYAFLAALVSWFVRKEHGFGRKTAADLLAFDAPVHDSIAFYGILGLVVLVIISWAEAVRFFSMHEDRFHQKYVSDAPKTAEGEPKERVVIDTRKTRGAALTFALTLGWIAVQRFYLGRVGTGVLGALIGVSGVALIPTAIALGEDVLLFTGIGLAAFVWVLSIIDGLRVLALGDRAFRYRYGRPVDATVER